MAEKDTKEVVEEPPVVMPDPQAAFHALDKYRSCIGGHGPRSDEEIELCDQAHTDLDEYFAAKDAVGAPPVQQAATAAKKPASKSDKYDKYETK